ncbi:MAG: flagellar hook protein FlgE [Deltaproteobacteria bacterium]|nr:flagellar hook protein FlgE [Deltaproteobacteria bacterium]
MLTSLFTGVTGLNANMTALSVIGNNIANMNTVGYKAGRASFADILSQSIVGVSGSNQVGLGVSLSSITSLFTQGALETTTSGLDLAIDGNGFYVLTDSTGALYYSRAGQFNLDKDGNIVNPEGYILRGYQADSAGNITSTIDDLTLSSSSVQPNPTSTVDIVGNLSSDAEIKGFVFTTGSNDAIRFTSGATTATASLTTNGGLISGNAYSGDGVASAIKAALEAQNGSLDTYTVTYDSLTGKFAIANDTGNSNALSIAWSSSALTTAEGMLGFTADDAIVVGSNAASDAAGGAFSVGNADDTSNFSTSITAYDSLGNSHQVTVYFRKDSTSSSGNTWEWYGVVGANDSTSGSTEVQANGALIFDTDGFLSSESSITYPTGGLDFSGGASQNQTIAFGFGTSIAEGGAGTNGMTQYGGSSTVNDQQQDGYGAGSFQSMSVDSNGVITGIFSNGKTMSMGQVVLAKFANPSALTSKGRNLFAESSDSGQPLAGVPNSAGRGGIHSNALELSTVDIAEEFVKMISAQRGFQANSKIITTTDEILNELVNLKR